uniref:dolichyl-phosphate-mannose--protein mannosyltransferase n=1 Tax=Timema genevievae TaxID=629358 RepID=A0A7R9JMY8_TIMGE|nr:unnamed protein product [Timema genevievae]
MTEISRFESRGRLENHFGKATLSIPDRDSNLDLPVIGSLAHSKSSALDHVATERRSRRMARSLLILLLTLGTLLKIRLLQMGPHPPTFSTADNPTARCSSFMTRFLTFSYLPAFNFFLLLWPQWLSFDWGMDAIPRITSLFDPRVFLALVFYCFLYRIVRHSLSVIFNVTSSPQEDFLQKEPRIYQNYQRLSGYQQHRRVILDGHRKVSNKQSRCFSSGSSDPEKFLSLCPVCKHNFTNSHHSLLCRNNNNNNNISSVEETGVEECTCQSILVKTSSHVPDNRSRVAHPKRGPSTSSNLNRAELVLLSLAFLTIPFLPATNLFFYVGFVVAERVLYLPSVGYCLLVGVGCHAMNERTSRRLVTLCLALLVVSFCVRTLLRNKDWYDEESLYRSGLHINPPKAGGAPTNSSRLLPLSVKGCRVAGGSAYALLVSVGTGKTTKESLGDRSKGMLGNKITYTIYKGQPWMKQLRWDGSHSWVKVGWKSPWVKVGWKSPWVKVGWKSSWVKVEWKSSWVKAGSYGNLGSVLSSKGRTEEAEWAFRMALRYRVNMADVHYNIGVLLQGKEHFQEAIKSYELAIHYRPSLALAYLNLGQLLERLSRCEEAVLVYRRCSRLDGTGLKDPRAHEATRVSALLRLGRLYANQGRLTEAAQAYQEAVDKMPEYFPPQWEKGGEETIISVRMSICHAAGVWSHTNGGIIVNLWSDIRRCIDRAREAVNPRRSLANALVVFSSTAEDGEIEVQILVG